jgi:hypothetical protein
VEPGAAETHSLNAAAFRSRTYDEGEPLMPRFLVIYLGGNQPSSPEEGKRNFAKYQEWLASLGADLVSPMNPIKNTRTLKPDGSVSESSTTLMSGYTILAASSIEEALEKAKACPFLEVNGTLEVSELIEMPG